jgi:hypothetical protein
MTYADDGVHETIHDIYDHYGELLAVSAHSFIIPWVIVFRALVFYLVQVFKGIALMVISRRSMAQGPSALSNSIILTHAYAEPHSGFTHIHCLPQPQ